MGVCFDKDIEDNQRAAKEPSHGIESQGVLLRQVGVPRERAETICQKIVEQDEIDKMPKCEPYVVFEGCTFEFVVATHAGRQGRLEPGGRCRILVWIHETCLLELAYYPFGFALLA